MRVLAVADSDSYLKWAAGMVDELPPSWLRRLVVLRSPLTPSTGQRAAATAGASLAGVVPPVLPLTAILREVEQWEPDIVLLACTGPVVDALAGALRTRSSGAVRSRRRRIVLVSGLPGLCIPPAEAAWLNRSQADLFVVHSRRELHEFSALGRDLGASGTVALARLPFLAAAQDIASRRSGRRVIFAAQAKVPIDPESRRDILRGLDALAGRRPDLQPVVKVRARRGEQQTHRERHPYESLWNELVEAGEVTDGSVLFADGPMRRHLRHAAGMVTVSSTAALEAIAASVPVLILSDFGIDETMLNLVFAGSGCVGTLADLVAGAFRHPDPAWLEDNYFHADGAQDWITAGALLVEQARAGKLPLPVPLLTSAANRRRRRRALLRLALPPTVLRARLAALRLSRRSRRMLQRALGHTETGSARLALYALPDLTPRAAAAASTDELASSVPLH